MVRKMVQLTEEQMESLERFAKKQGVPVAELIGRAVEQFICAETERKEKQKKKAKAFAGSMSDVPDLSRNHDLYLEEIYAHETSGDKE